MKIFVTIYRDYDRTINLYVGTDRQAAESATIQDVEGVDFYNAGAAEHVVEVWENGVKIEENSTRIPHPDDEEDETE